MQIIEKEGNNFIPFDFPAFLVVNYTFLLQPKVFEQSALLR